MQKQDNAATSPAGNRVLARLRSMAQSNASKTGLNQSKTVNTQSLAKKFILQRAISRIFESAYGEMFAMKGGMLMMHLEEVSLFNSRETDDIDVQIPGFDGAIEDLADIARKVLGNASLEDDGIVFNTDRMGIQSRPDEGVPGGSLTIPAQLGTLNVKFKMDVTFDSRPVFDVAETSTIPSILGDDFPPVTVRRVPFSWTLADKVQAQVRHGITSTRLKDFYDMYLIVSKDKADPKQTAEAMRMTFDLFKCPLPKSVDDIVAFSHDYAVRNAEAWDREKTNRRFAVATPGLVEVCEVLRKAIGPMLEEANKLHQTPAETYKTTTPVLETIAKRIASMRESNGIDHTARDRHEVQPSRTPGL
jgi:hypothetical protein